MSKNAAQYPSIFKPSNKLRCFEVTRENVPSFHMLLTLLHLQNLPFTVSIDYRSACSSNCPKAKGNRCIEIYDEVRDLEFANGEVDALRGTCLTELNKLADLDLLDDVAFYNLFSVCRQANIFSEKLLTQKLYDKRDLLKYRKDVLGRLDMFLTLTGRNDDRKFVVRELKRSCTAGLQVFYESYINNECERTIPAFNYSSKCRPDMINNLRSMLKHAV